MGFKDYILQDYYVTNGECSLWRFCLSYYLHPSFRVLVFFRLLQRMGEGRIVYPLLRAIYIRKTYKLGLFLDVKTTIGAGVEFPHNFPLIINTGSTIGKCCVIHPNVLIAGNRRTGGKPKIGDYVFIGNGSKIIGNVTIGSWCFLSPGAVVTKNIPDGCTVGFGLNNILNNNGRENVLPYLADRIKKKLNNDISNSIIKNN